MSNSVCDPWTVARQAPLSLGFSRQEYWKGLPCPPLGDLPDPWIEPGSPVSPARAGGFSTTVATWEAPVIIITITKTEVNVYDALPASHSPEGLTHTVSALGSPGGLGERH